MNWFRQPRMWGKNNIESVKMIDLIVYLRVSNTLFFYYRFIRENIYTFMFL